MSKDLFAAFGQAGPSESKQLSRPRVADESGFLESGFLVDFGGIPAQASAPVTKARTAVDEDALWHPGEDGNEVLFDADNHDEDFGDFEVVGTSPIRSGQHAASKFEGLEVAGSEQPAHRAGQETLIDLNDVSHDKISNGNSNATHGIQDHTAGQPSMFMVTSAQDYADWGEFEDAPVEQTPRAEVSHQLDTSRVDDTGFDEGWESFESQADVAQNTEEGTPELEDEWQSFDEPQEVIPSLRAEDRPKTGHSGQAQIHSASSGPQPDLHTAKSVQPGQERPTNVPPPAILLQLLPPVLHDLHAQTKSDQSLMDLAHNIGTLYMTAGYILVGRSLRWKRDTRLAQSMRIGQAGKGGGMKLTTLDRGETIKEDQEAAEVVASWSKYSHAFNSVLSKAGRPRLVNLATNMPVKTLAGPATVSAPAPCPICGLRRSERVVTLAEPEDVFDDFWTEYWGHSACYNFWYTYKPMLNQR